MEQYLYVLDCRGEDFNVWAEKYTQISDLRLNWRPLEWGFRDVSHDDRARKQWVMHTHTYLVGWSSPCPLWRTTSWRCMLGQCVPLYILTPLCKMNGRCQLHVLACSALVSIERQACGEHQSWFGWFTQIKNLLPPIKERSLIHWPSSLLPAVLSSSQLLHTWIFVIIRDSEPFCVPVTGSSCSHVSCNTRSLSTIICFMQQVGSALIYFLMFYVKHNIYLNYKGL